MASNKPRLNKGSRFQQGRYQPVNPDKVIGDPNNLIFRSGWERKMMYKLDMADYVVKWGSEVTVIPYIGVDGLPHRYFMDFTVVGRDAQGNANVTLIEVKPYKETIAPVSKKGKRKAQFLREVKTWETNSRKWAATEDYCAKKGWSFQKVTEKQLYAKK